MFTSQKDGSQVLEKDTSSIVKLARSLGEDLHAFQRGREKIYSCKLFKLNAPEKGGHRAPCQEEFFLKVSHSEGDTRSSWSVLINVCLRTSFLLSCLRQLWG